MKNRFFTADHHLFHHNIIKHCNRPFSNVNEMFEVMVERHNAIVTPKDDVYILGDFAKLSADKLEKSLNVFNGNKIFILGNHDKVASINKMLGCGAIMQVYPVYGLTIDNDYIWLSHYAHRSWNKSCHGSFHLYGHSHGKLPPFGRSMDVGVDTNNFTPYAWEDLKTKLETVEIINI